ncbi:hypothetical protein IFR05_003278 [Cadophora sp. M221]|nr:hypothetical protein IFR05_003278 [Cadophora sp. M221]
MTGLLPRASAFNLTVSGRKIIRSEILLTVEIMLHHVSRKQCAVWDPSATTPAYPEYFLDIAIAEFFSQTDATRETCDAKANELVGGKIVPVTVQGNCSYSVYAGAEFEFVVQFRLKSLMLKSETVALVREIYGFPENSDENFVWRKTLMSDVARCFALSWKAPQEVDSNYHENLRRTYTKDLQLLLHALPPRFHQIIRKCLGSMDAILSLPMVLLHRDFGTCNIMVDGKSCHLTGIIDWAEAEICHFGQNLHSLQALTGALH